MLFCFQWVEGGSVDFVIVGVDGFAVVEAGMVGVEVFGRGVVLFSTGCGRVR